MGRTRLLVVGGVLAMIVMLSLAVKVRQLERKVEELESVAGEQRARLAAALEVVDSAVDDLAALDPARSAELQTQASLVRAGDTRLLETPPNRDYLLFFDELL